MATATGLFPRQITVEADQLAVALGADAVEVAAVAPAAATVQSATYVPAAAITGAATNNRTVNLVNTGQAGAGTTVVATLSFGAGVNAPAFAQKALTLSVVAGALDLAAGDVLEWQSTHVGTGIADPGGIVRVQMLTN